MLLLAHRHSAEITWWKSVDIDPLPIARQLWQHAGSKEHDQFQQQRPP
jgi:hypothetical protein